MAFEGLTIRPSSGETPSKGAEMAFEGLKIRS
jgi:hypothetical protein